MAREDGTKTSYRGVRRLSKGRYRIRVTTKDKATGKQKELDRVVEAHSTEEAALIRQELKSELDGQASSSTRFTVSGPRGFREVAEQWLARKLSRRRSDGSPALVEGTRRRYENSVKVHLIGYFGDEPIDEISAEHVEELMSDLTSPPNAMRAATVNTQLRILRQILGTVKNTAASDVRTLPEDDGRTTESEPNLLTQEEVRRFLWVAKTEYPQHYPLILLMFSTGMRISTALALRVEDLDEVNGFIKVRRRLSGKDVIPGVKRSRAGADFPPLWPEVAEALHEHRSEFNPAQRASGLVFPTRKGTHRTRTILNNPYKDICERAGITARLTPSSGPRRTATLLYRKAADSAVARHIVGHTTTKMHDHYAPADVEEKMAAADSVRRGLQFETGYSSGDQAAKTGVTEDSDSLTI
ncbi:MAG: tyrosine-type recombinase/integrase [Myxococcota bacterium]